MRIKDIYNTIWFEAFIKIMSGKDEEVLWEGYIYDLPDEYMERIINCIIPMVDYGPVLGIELI